MSESSARPDGLRIKAARKARGWTQGQLAEKTGYRVSVIQKVEAGKYFGVPCLQACVEALGEAYATCKPHDNGQMSSTTPPSIHDKRRDLQSGTEHIELVIDRDFNTYSSKEQNNLLSAIKELLGISGNILVVRKRPGTVKLTLALTPEQSEKLIRAVKAGDLAQFGVIDAKSRHVAEPGADEITISIAALKSGDPAAIQGLWHRYFHRLVTLARTRLRGTVQAHYAAEDVAMDTIVRLREGERGSFQPISDQHLWQLLVLTTAKRCADLVRHKKGRRGVTRDTAATSLEEIVSREPTPEFAAQMAEECERLLKQLGDERLRSVAIYKLEGFTNEEIAAKMNCSVRSIERKLQVIRSIWQSAPQE